MTKRLIRTPTVLQFEAAECGAASLAIILGYYGKWIPLSELRSGLGVSRDGTNVLRIRDYAQTFGLQVKGKRFLIDDLGSQNFPFICHWESAHFLVVEGVKNGQVYLSDPASGRRKIGLDDFNQSTPTKIMLELLPTKDFKREGQAPNIWRGLYDRLKKYKSVIVSLVLLSALSTVPNIALASITSTLIDIVFIKGQREFLNGLMLLAIIMISLLLPGIRLEKVIFRKLGIILSRDMSLGFITQLLKLPISFFEARHASEVNQRLSLNQSVAKVLTSTNGEAIVNITSMAIYAIFLLLISWPLAIFCFIIQSLQITIIRKTENQRTESGIKLSQAQGELFATTYDTLRTIETVKSSAIEDQIFRRWTGQHAKYTNELQSLTRVSNRISTSGKIIGDLLTIAILIGGGLLVINGYLALGWLISYRQIYSSFSAPLIEIADSWSSVEQLFGDVNKLDDVLTETPDSYSSIVNISSLSHERPQASSSSVSPTTVKGFPIKLTDLHFSFGGAIQDVVDGINLEIPTGSRLGMVGSTGCGKSTLMRLIAGIYKPTSGAIHYDNKNLSDFGVNHWHESVSYVTQFSPLLPGSILDNIRLFNQHYSKADVIGACQAACIHDDILLMPDGYETMTDQANFKLSGGQRQRLNIARALVREPKVLLLDEATSALDARTEEKIVSHLNDLNCTQIVIAHRLNTIVSCNQIIYLDSGHIVEQGTHRELLLKKGAYSALVDFKPNQTNVVTGGGVKFA
ncbi:ATP-binding cassette domain-containing protein [Synechococcus sp. CS-197]|uniref:ATP-binding cassette domain-containing protein n=1 Tax=Synechococcus sp. CS-197 TaxID=2847985 RepID=UPI00015254CA|nr:ATP-binding cassette domain-containing protein [Synechococcus sp. CS-197]MCT0251540.1 peptidase domain-containing ABC transporter [Synechococcus sp. CS-197]CAK22983.1 ABC-type multidrug transport system, ATPase and permease components [Synechococcus sp. WH 7803]